MQLFSYIFHKHFFGSDNKLIFYQLVFIEIHIFNLQYWLTKWKLVESVLCNAAGEVSRLEIVTAMVELTRFYKTFEETLKVSK